MYKLLFSNLMLALFNIVIDKEGATEKVLQFTITLKSSVMQHSA
jgi:hypothetical protein